MLIIAGLSLAFTLAGAIRIARRVTQPVEQLAAAAREIELGNYDIRSATPANDEVGALARAFDGMAQGLVSATACATCSARWHPATWSRASWTPPSSWAAEVEATVMFTDMRGFTTIAESLTPQQSLQP
jgi:adenylate cyclase